VCKDHFFRRRPRTRIATGGFCRHVANHGHSDTTPLAGKLLGSFLLESTSSIQCNAWKALLCPIFSMVEEFNSKGSPFVGTPECRDRSSGLLSSLAVSFHCSYMKLTPGIPLTAC
jgi:hypothetical protein